MLALLELFHSELSAKVKCGNKSHGDMNSVLQFSPSAVWPKSPTSLLQYINYGTQSDGGKAISFSFLS